MAEGHMSEMDTDEALIADLVRRAFSRISLKVQATAPDGDRKPVLVGLVGAEVLADP